MAGPKDKKGKPAGGGGGGDRQIEAASVNAPGLQIVGGLQAGGKLGGMRSPLVGTGGQAAAKDEAETAPAPAAKSRVAAGAAAAGGGGGGFGNREVSAIQGMSNADPLAASTATHLSHVMFDKGRHVRTFSVKLVVGIVVLAIAAAFVLLPDLRNGTLRKLNGIRNSVISSVRYQKKPRKKVPKTYQGRVTRPGSAPSSEAPPAQKVAKGNCGKLLKMTAGVATLRVEERVAMAECHMMVDRPEAAEQTLRPLLDKLAVVTEKDLNRMKSHLTLADALHTMVNAYLKQGKQREADSVIRNRCATWAQTNTCVAKLMVLADRRITKAAGLERMFATRGILDDKAQGRVWLAGAQLALVDNKPAAADQRYVLALGSLPRESLWLRKQLYETQALDLYNRGEMLRLKQSVDAALAELGGADKAAKTKLTLFRDLANPRNKSRTVKNVITREEITYRVKQDVDLVDILGPDALRYGYEDDFLRLVKRTIAHFSSRGRSSTALKRLAVWEIRAHVSTGDAAEATISVLDGYERSYGRDVFSRHMRGVVYANLTGNARYQILAAQEFQSALRIKSNWESLYGLGATLIRAGKKESVPAVIKDMDRKVGTKGEKYWAELLKAEYYIAVENYGSAQTILGALLRDDADLVMPQRLRVQLFQKRAMRAEADNAQLKIDELSRSEKFSRSREGFASPLGVMALGKRPLE